MKRLATALVCALVVSASLANTVPLCPSPTRLPPAKLSILSFRNSAGEWTSQLNFTRGTPGDLGVWDIDLAQEKVSCEDGGDLVTTVLTLTSLQQAPPQVTTLQQAPPQVTTLQQAPPQVTIKPGYKEVPGVCISKLHTTAKTWAEARQVCSEEGTHLAIINSEEEATYYKNMVAEHRTFSDSINNEYFFLGFDYSTTHSRFVTVLGTDLNSTGYTAWATGEPNSVVIIDDTCGGMDRTGKLYDLWCKAKLAFFCEQ